MQYIYQFVKVNVNFEVIETSSCFYASKEKALEDIEKESEFFNTYADDAKVEDYKLHPWVNVKMQDGIWKSATIVKELNTNKGEREFFGYVQFKLL